MISYKPPCFAPLLLRNHTVEYQSVNIVKIIGKVHRILFGMHLKYLYICRCNMLIWVCLVGCYCYCGLLDTDIYKPIKGNDFCVGLGLKILPDAHLSLCFFLYMRSLSLLPAALHPVHLFYLGSFLPKTASISSPYLPDSLACVQHGRQR